MSETLKAEAMHEERGKLAELTAEADRAFASIEVIQRCIYELEKESKFRAMSFARLREARTQFARMFSVDELARFDAEHPATAARKATT
jgi:hypothetical protein